MGTVCEQESTVQGTEHEGGDLGMIADAIRGTPEAAVVQAADEAAEQEAEAMAELQEQASKLLGDAGRAFRKGEQEYGKWVLKAGELAWEYTQIRMRLTGMGRKTQEAAYSALEGEFNKWASSKVRVDTIVRASMACRLFSPHLPAKVALPYGHWRDAWCQLVELQGDTWAIPELVSEEAVTEFKRATEAGMSREESLDAVKAVQRKLARMQAELAQQAAAEQRRAEQEAKQDALEAAAERQAVEDEARALEEAAKTAEQDAERKRLTEEAEQKRQELLQAQRAEIEARAKAEAEAREAARKAAEAKKATERQAKAEEKAADREARRQEREAQREAKATVGQAIEPVQGPGLKAMAKQGTAKDVAGMMVELLTGTDEPDSVLEEFLRQAKASGELSKGSMAAVDAALVIMTRRSQAA